MVGVRQKKHIFLFFPCFHAKKSKRKNEITKDEKGWLGNTPISSSFFPMLFFSYSNVTTDDLQSNHSEIRYHNVFSSLLFILYIFIYTYFFHKHQQTEKQQSSSSKRRFFPPSCCCCRYIHINTDIK